MRLVASSAASVTASLWRTAPTALARGSGIGAVGPWLPGLGAVAAALCSASLVPGCSSTPASSSDSKSPKTSLTLRLRIEKARSGLPGPWGVSSSLVSTACTWACSAGVVVITSVPVSRSSIILHASGAAAPSPRTVASISRAVSESPKRRGL